MMKSDAGAWRTLLVAGAAAAAVAAAPAHAAETRGPAIGANRYVAEIANNPGERDVDDYVNVLVAGERLSAVLTVNAGSELVPSLEVVGPDDQVRPVTVRAAKTGRTLEIRSMKTDAPGNWTVRVRGVDGTQGAYSIAFRTTKAPPVVRRRMTASFGAEAELEFGAGPGLLADVTVAWKRGTTPLEIASVLDWTGFDAFAADGGASRVVVKGTTATLSGLPLGRANGTYRLRLRGADGALASGTVTVRLRRAEWPSGTAAVRLTDEPILSSGQSLLGIAGRPVRLAGLRLVPGVRIYFGDAEATSVSYIAGGSEVYALVPPGESGSVVDVAAVGPDGQASIRHDAFTYVPQPHVYGVTRMDGAPVAGWSAKGGLQIRLTGEHFRAGQEVRFPGNVDAVPQIVSESEMTVTVPACPPGTDHLYVVDEWDQKGRSPVQFELKTPPSFAAQPFAPTVAAVQRDVAVTLRGAGFERTDTLFVAGAPVTSQFVDPGTRRFTFPASEAGEYAVKIRDRLGVEVDGPSFAAKVPPVVDAVAVLDGLTIGGGIPAAGGNTIRVTGTGFHASDTVLLGGTVVTKSASGTDSFDFAAPAGILGPATLKITDGADQTAVVDDAVTYVGFEDVTAARLPAASDEDSLAAVRGVLADLDGDGADDLVIAAPPGAYPGMRATLTRVLLNDGSGVLADRTADRFPTAYSDPTGTDDWNANALAVGDLDDDGDPDLVLAGMSNDPQNASDVRVFENDGAGSFLFDGDTGPAASAHPAVYAYDNYGWSHQVTTARDPAGQATAVAIGDVDGDGADDLVVGRDAVETETTLLNPDVVDFSQTPPFVYYWNVNYNRVNWTTVHAATRVYRNRTADGERFQDVTDAALPSLGTDTSSTLPAFAARDLALADLDGDDDLDLVLTWNDPMTVSVAGLAQADGAAEVATRVLINDGSGAFSDATGTWLPAGSGDEYFQADRLALADLDADGDPDLVLLSAAGVDAWKGVPKHTKPALRILRNDGGRFTAVSSALPALPAGDDWRGRAIVVRDVDGDRKADLVVGTTDSLANSGKPLRSARWLLQTDGFRFVDATGFLPSAAADSGQADDLLLGDLAGDGTPTLLLLDTGTPDTSDDGALLRAFDWKR